MDRIIMPLVFTNSSLMEKRTAQHVRSAAELLMLLKNATDELELNSKRRISNYEHTISFNY